MYARSESKDTESKNTGITSIKEKRVMWKEWSAQYGLWQKVKYVKNNIETLLSVT